MKKITLTIIVLAFVFLSLFTIPATVYADDGGPQGDQIIFGQNYTLKSHETLNGNLVVIAGTVTLEEDSLVTGDIFLAGGAVWIYGEMKGSLVAIGGGVFLGEKSEVNEDVVVLGGSLNRSKGAIIGGDVISSLPNSRKIFNSSALTGMLVPRFWEKMNPLWNIPKGMFESLVWAILGALLVLFMPVPTERVSKAIVSQPALSGGFGILTIFVLPFVSLILLITIILIPVIPLLLIVLIFALVFGWMSIGYEVGRRIAEQFRLQWAMPVSAGIGILVLTVIAKAVGSIACIGWIVPFIILMIGLGGVIITRFGSRDNMIDSKPSTAPKSPEKPIPPIAPIEIAKVGQVEMGNIKPDLPVNQLDAVEKTAGEADHLGEDASNLLVTDKVKKTGSSKIKSTAPAAIAKPAPAPGKSKPDATRKAATTSGKK